MEVSFKEENWRNIENTLSSPVQIGDREYYLEDYLEGFDRLFYTSYENEKVFISVSIKLDFNTDDIDRKNNNQDWYQERLRKIVPVKYIDGMTKLLLENTR